MPLMQGAAVSFSEQTSPTSWLPVIINSSSLFFARSNQITLILMILWLGWLLGNNGTIDGQGAPWWTRYRAGELNATRPYMIEIMFSDQIQIFNLTLINSPSWFVHPIYSRFNSYFHHFSISTRHTHTHIYIWKNYLFAPHICASFTECILFFNFDMFAP